MRLHGALDPVTGNGIEHVMGVQLQNSYFPVSEAQMDATIEYQTLDAGRAGAGGRRRGRQRGDEPPGHQPGLPHQLQRQVGVLHRRP